MVLMVSQIEAKLIYKKKFSKQLDPSEFFIQFKFIHLAT